MYDNEKSVWSIETQRALDSAEVVNGIKIIGRPLFDSMTSGTFSEVVPMSDGRVYATIDGVIYGAVAA